eukprot:g33747.t1
MIGATDGAPEGKTALSRVQMMFRLPKKKKKQNVGKDKPTGSQEAYQTLLKELAERDKKKGASDFVNQEVCG